MDAVRRVPPRVEATFSGNLRKFSIDSPIPATFSYLSLPSFPFARILLPPQNLKAWTDTGDIIGANGTIRRTDKGELTLYAKE